MGTALQYPGNVVAGTLTSSIASSGTGTFTASGFPTSIGDGSGRPFVVEVGPGLSDDEKILCISYSSGTFTPSSSPLGRGWDTTSPIAHQAGETIKLVPDSTSFQDFGDHVYKPTRDDHPQYARTDGTRAITGAQAFNNGLTVGAGGIGVTAGGLTVTAGGLTVVSGTAALQAITGTSLASTGAVSGTSMAANLAGVGGRYVGSTSAGAPSSGTFLAGDFVVDATGSVFTCITGGSPGTWEAAPGGFIAGAKGPAANTTVTNTSSTILTVATPNLLTGHVYKYTVSGSYQQITAAPVFAKLTVSSVLMTSTTFAYCNGGFMSPNDFFGGSVSTYVTGTGVQDTINLVSQSSGSGSSSKFVGTNQCAIIVERLA